MPRISLMINGLPGKVAATIAAQAVKDDRFELLPFSLTGPEIEETETTIETVRVELIQPENRADRIEKIKAAAPGLITVDYTHPTAVNSNCTFYCEHHLPFVMGTTGGDREKLFQTVRASSICAVIAPNMAKQIVGFQAMLNFAAANFPGMFAGYSLTIKESHQAAKADTSGTARAMVQYFNQLGIEFSEEEIIKERDPEIQKKQWGIPGEHLGGHGWHTYTLLSPDESVKFEFTHNINGRKIYAEGTFDAAAFLGRKVEEGRQGTVFSMIDVLRESREKKT